MPFLSWICTFLNACSSFEGVAGISGRDCNTRILQNNTLNKKEGQESNRVCVCLSVCSGKRKWRTSLRETGSFLYNIFLKSTGARVKLKKPKLPTAHALWVTICCFLHLWNICECEELKWVMLPMQMARSARSDVTYPTMVQDTLSDCRCAFSFFLSSVLSSILQRLPLTFYFKHNSFILYAKLIVNLNPWDVTYKSTFVYTADMLTNFTITKGDRLSILIVKTAIWHHTYSSAIDTWPIIRRGCISCGQYVVASDSSIQRQKTKEDIPHSYTEFIPVSCHNLKASVVSLF